MRTAVLTFDDGLASHAEFVAPLLKEHGFGGTFFICTAWVGAKRPDGPKCWRHLDRQQIKTLADDGFEIGNHLHTHGNMLRMARSAIQGEIHRAEAILKDIGITDLVSFCPPGFHYDQDTLSEIRAAGYRYVRVGCGKDWEPGTSGTGAVGTLHSLTAGRCDEICCSVAGRNYSVDMFARDAERMSATDVSVLCFHDFEEAARVDLDWSYAEFETLVRYLRDNEFRVLALRDLGTLSARTS